MVDNSYKKDVVIISYQKEISILLFEPSMEENAKNYFLDEIYLNAVYYQFNIISKLLHQIRVLECTVVVSNGFI